VLLAEIFKTTNKLTTVALMVLSLLVPLMGLFWQLGLALDVAAPCLASSSA
jgi:hypothetical protein